MKFLLLFLVCLLSKISYSVTYSTNGNGAWNNPGIWSPGIPPNPLAVGDNIVINHVVTTSYTLIINGSISITNSGVLSGPDDIVINSGASFSNSGAINLTGDFDVNNGGVFTNSGTLTCNTFTNSGVGINSGTISTILSFDNTNGSFTNSGTINSGDELINDNGVFINSGTITTVDDLENNGGIFTNNGDLNIGDDIDNNSGGIFVNNGSIDIADDLDNTDGNFINNGVIDVTTDLDNDNGVYTENGITEVGGNVDNTDGLIDGLGLLCVNGDLDQNGTGIVSGAVDICNCGGLTNPIIGGGTVGASVTFCSSMLLPIELVSFEVKNYGRYVELIWVTASEINNDYFIVQKSSDGINYVDIVKVNAAGNSTENIIYKEFDRKLSIGISYYRLKQVDYDGSYFFSRPRSVNITRIDPICFAYSIIDNEISFNIYSEFQMNTELQIYDQLGRLVTDYNLELPKGESTFSFNLRLESGFYIVVLKKENNTLLSNKSILIH